MCMSIIIPERLSLYQNVYNNSNNFYMLRHNTVTFTFKYRENIKFLNFSIQFQKVNVDSLQLKPRRVNCNDVKIYFKYSIIHALSWYLLRVACNIVTMYSVVQYKHCYFKLQTSLKRWRHSIKNYKFKYVLNTTMYDHFIINVTNFVKYNQKSCL